MLFSNLSISLASCVSIERKNSILEEMRVEKKSCISVVVFCK